MPNLADQKRALKAEILRGMKDKYQQSRPPHQYWLFVEAVRKLMGELTVKRLETWVGKLRKEQDATPGA